MPCRDSRGCKRFLGRALGRPRGGCPWRGELGVGQSEQWDAGKRAPASTPHPADVAKPCARPILHRFPVPLAPAPRLLAAQDYLSSPNPRAPGLRLLRSAFSHRQSRSNRPLRSRTRVLPPRSLAPAAIAISPARGCPRSRFFPGRQETDPARTATGGVPHIAALASAHRPWPPPPQNHSAGRPSAHLHAPPPGTPPSSLVCGSGLRPQTREEAKPASPVPPATRSRQFPCQPQETEALVDGHSWKDSGAGARAAYWPPCAGVPPCAALPRSKALRPHGQFPVLCPELRAPPVE